MADGFYCGVIAKSMRTPFTKLVAIFWPSLRYARLRTVSVPSFVSDAVAAGPRSVSTSSSRRPFRSDVAPGRDAPPGANAGPGAPDETGVVPDETALAEPKST